MLKLYFPEMLMLAASVVVVVAGFHLRLRHLRRCRHIVRTPWPSSSSSSL
jgi:hypothetical protein